MLQHACRLLLAVVLYISDARLLGKCRVLYARKTNQRMFFIVVFAAQKTNINTKKCTMAIQQQILIWRPATAKGLFLL